MKGVLVLTLVGWSFVARADPVVEVTFRVSPSPVNVTRPVLGYVGSTQGPLSLDLGKADSLKLEFSSPGYGTESRMISRLELQQGVYPPLSQQPIHLTALTWRTRWESLGPWRFVPLAVMLGLPLLPRRRKPLEQTRVAAQFPGYQATTRLGTGAFGEVWRASRKDGSEVAIKVLRTPLAAQEGQRKRFRREVQICRELRHPNIVRLEDWGETRDGDLFLVLELLEGTPLDLELKANPAAAPGRLQALLPGLGSALQTLHDQGMVHRDIKPSNLFLCRDGTIKLLDFGISRGVDLTVATETGVSLGTPAYMAPEQIQGQIRAESDQYALGILCFEMLTGRRPFEDDDPMAVLYKHVNEPMPGVPGMSVSVDTVLRRMLHKLPECRYHRVEMAVADLLEALQEQSVEPGETVVS